ncbi:MAG: nitroreductase [Pseudomonadales bacterium]|nr:nitroreductase [Pseudomonadales bacterium]
MSQEIKSVTEIIKTRRSIRAFLNKPVEKSVMEEILQQAARAPSGGNLQPWKVYAIAGEVRDQLVNTVSEKQVSNPIGDGSEYDIYPPDLADPYRSRRRDVGNQLYQLIGIPREDKMAKFAQLAKNFQFFGAPVGLIFTFDKQMGVGQHVDLGLYMQNVLLLCKEKGLDTCAQEAWAVWHKTIRDVVGIPQNELVFCGVAVGYADPNAKINELISDRANLEDFAELKGFD